MKKQLAKTRGFKAMVLRWLGSGSTVDGDSGLGASSNVAGVVVNSERMLQLSAVWACARLISETIATLPLGIYERTPDGKRVAKQHPLHTIIHDQPNSETTASVHWEAVIATMLLRGNARVEKLLVGGRLVGLAFLHPDRLNCTVGRSGAKEWRYRQENGEERVIPADRIWSIPGFSLDGKNGVSVIQHGATVFGGALAADAAANATFANGLRPTTAWKYPGVLTPDQRSEARAAIKKLSGAVGSGEPVILEAGTDVSTVGINPADAQLLESRAFSTEEICRWFRVPPFMVGHSEKSTSWGTGIEQQMIGFLTFTLAPWLKRVEQAINKDLLAPADKAKYFAKFSVEGLLRADSAGRAAFYTSMVTNGIMTRDECRELEDLPRMGGNANVLTIPSALAPLDEVGNADDGETARAALQAWLRESYAPER